MTLTTTPDEFRIARESNRVTSVCREVFADTDTPVSIYRKVAAGKLGTFLLESAEQGGVWTRFSFVGAGVFGVLSERDGRAHWIPTEGSDLSAERLVPGGVAHLAPVEALNAAYEHWASAQVEGLPPLTSGFVGYLGWETIRQFERLENPPTEGPDFPTQGMSFVSELVVIDHREGAVVLIANVLTDDPDEEPDAQWAEAQARLDRLQDALMAPVSTPLGVLDRQAIPNATRLTPEAEYLAGVEIAKQRIVDGDIFQVVLSQRFDMPCTADPLDVYRVLRHLNPSPFLYLLNAADNENRPFAVVGSSPEALITVGDGRVLSHPIAGSRPRGVDIEQDQLLEKELLADEKERSEHIMLVDLARNDLLRVCEPSSVEVTEFMRIERFSHIMHIVSTVEGELAPGENAISALQATFPAGTLSGAPKPMALQIIDELEQVRRGVYGGVVGYFGLGGAADLAIAIRTATIQDGVAMVQAGGGIVADSVAETEDLESRNKAAAPLRAVAIANSLQEIRPSA